jgi:hypothetical protein
LIESFERWSRRNKRPRKKVGCRSYEKTLDIIKRVGKNYKKAETKRNLEGEKDNLLMGIRSVERNTQTIFSVT